MLFNSKKAGNVKLPISRSYPKVLLLSCLFAALGANAASSANRDQTLVPPPPPIAIDLGGGLSSGIDYSGVNMYPGTFSRFGNTYSGYGNGYGNGYSNGYPSAASSLSSATAAQNSMAEAMRQYTKAFDIDLNSSDALKQRGLYRYAMIDRLLKLCLISGTDK